MDRSTRPMSDGDDVVDTLVVVGLVNNHREMSERHCCFVGSELLSVAAVL